jgi:hypothetical protein
VSVDNQKRSLVRYTSKHGVVHKHLLHSQHLNFILVSLFLVEHAGTEFSYIVQASVCYILCQLFLGGLLMELLLPCLAVKTLSGERSVLMCGSSLWRTPLGTPVKPWTMGAVGQELLLPVHCVKHMSVKPSVSLSVSLSLGAEMSASSNKHASESYTPIPQCLGL